MAWLEQLYSTADLTPHGFCLTWRPDLLWLQIVPDGIIGLSYYSIPLALAYFVWRRQDLAFGWIFWMFAVFILACGTTHWFEIWTLWHPDYATQGLLKVGTAIASLATATILWPLLPQALALPSPAALRRVNDELSRQISERDKAVYALRRETQERLRAEEMLRQAQKMEAIGQLTGGIAHDFNNLLTVVFANLERAAVLSSDRPAIRQAIEAAQKGAERAASLTAQLLAFARRQPLAPQVLDVGRLLGDLAELLRRSLDERIAIETVKGAGLWHAFCDPAQLESAVVNLALNARDAMAGRGTLTLEVANAPLDDAYASRYDDVAAGDYVMVAVSDSGTGMAPEIVARAFEPFFTTKSEGKGTGLGLSQVFGFVKQSGGHVELYSEPGQGTTVKLYLPRARPSDVASPVERAVELQPRGSETVLVVEDDPHVRAATVAMVGDLGYVVLEAGDAEAALFVLQARPVDLLFTDVVMPGGLSTPDLAVRARALQPAIRVLYTSGYTHAAIVHHGRLDEGVELISKPYRRDELARKFRKLLD